LARQREAAGTAPTTREFLGAKSAAEDAAVRAARARVNAYLKNPAHAERPAPEDYKLAALPTNPMYQQERRTLQGEVELAWPRILDLVGDAGVTMPTVLHR